MLDTYQIQKSRILEYIKSAKPIVFIKKNFLIYGILYYKWFTCIAGPATTHTNHTFYQIESFQIESIKLKLKAKLN